MNYTWTVTYNNGTHAIAWPLTDPLIAPLGYQNATLKLQVRLCLVLVEWCRGVLQWECRCLWQKPEWTLLGSMVRHPLFCVFVLGRSTACPKLIPRCAWLNTRGGGTPRVPGRHLPPPPPKGPPANS